VTESGCWEAGRVQGGVRLGMTLGIEHGRVLLVQQLSIRVQIWCFAQRRAELATC